MSEQEKCPKCGATGLELVVNARILTGNLRYIHEINGIECSLAQKLQQQLAAMTERAEKAEALLSSIRQRIGAVGFGLTQEQQEAIADLWDWQDESLKSKMVIGGPADADASGS